MATPVSVRADLQIMYAVSQGTMRNAAVLLHFRKKKIPNKIMTINDSQILCHIH